MENKETATNTVAQNEVQEETITPTPEETVTEETVAEQTASNDYSVKNKNDGNPFSMEVEKTKSKKPNGFWKGVLKVLNYIFIDG
ncbi:MAG: hypothetical protein IJY70_02450, partial [Clostridia bacterium]|nr:hypothetical protein [Clostridia bacterium]